MGWGSKLGGHLLSDLVRHSQKAAGHQAPLLDGQVAFFPGHNVGSGFMQCLRPRRKAKTVPKVRKMRGKCKLPIATIAHFFTLQCWLFCKKSEGNFQSWFWDYWGYKQQCKNKVTSPCPEQHPLKILSNVYRRGTVCAQISIDMPSRGKCVLPVKGHSSCAVPMICHPVLHNLVSFILLLYSKMSAFIDFSTPCDLSSGDLPPSPHYARNKAQDSVGTRWCSLLGNSVRSSIAALLLFATEVTSLLRTTAEG